jgi:isoquinoline 1-oxidoreductase beta subunit
MSATRRDFLKLTALAGSSLLIGISVVGEDAQKKTFKPNQWLRIDPDGKVTIQVGKAEMGQGVRTSLPMIVAEELDADWEHIAVEQAMPGPDFTRLGTGGSWSIGGSWKGLRTAGATARQLLLLAAAAKLGVDVTALRTERSAVIHDASGRRLTYGELASAASAIGVPKDVPLKAMKDFRLVGRRTKRLDGPDIVKGSAKYGIDTRVPGMLFATIERPPTVGGSVGSIDAAKAKHVRGVRDVVTIPSGVAVVADNTWAALKGRTLLQVTWNDGPNAAFSSEEYVEEATRAAAGEGVVMRKEGDGAAAFTNATKVLEATYVYPFYAHAALETMNCIADVRESSAEIWAPTQTANEIQEKVAELLKLPKTSVAVHVTLMGGGFGRRLRADYAVEAATLSRAIKKPVQVLWTRTDDMRDGHLQHASVHALRAAIGEDGRMTAWLHRKASNPVMTGKTWGPDELKDLPGTYRGSSWGTADVPYAVPHLETAYVRVDSPLRYGPWRSVFAPSSVFARESFVDEAAHAAGRDPLQFRLDHLAGGVFKIGDDAYDRARIRRVLETVRDRSGWGTPLVDQGRGRGVAVSMYEGETVIAYVAEVALDRDKRFRIERVVAVVDCGPVVNPIGIEQQVEGGIVWAMAQLRNQITVRKGRVEQSTYRDYPVPRIDDMPKVEVHILPSSGQQPFGIGEPPVPPLVPAVLNAYFAASGVRVRRLPLGT